MDTDSMDNNNKCQKIIVYIGPVAVPLDKWITDGPQKRYLHSQDYLYCADTDPPHLIGLVPLEYRNNELVFFLTALGIFEYPWPIMYTLTGQLPPMINLLQSDTVPAAEHNAFITIDKQGSDVSFLFEGNEIYPNIKLHLPSEWSIGLGEIFGFAHPIVTNDEGVFSQRNHSEDKLYLSSKSETFICSIHAHALLFSTLERYINQYMPDETFADNVVYHSGINEHFDSVQIIADSKKHDISLVILAIKIPSIKIENFAAFLRFFAVTRLGNGEILLSQLNEVLKPENIILR
jgi:hypothetical protein